MLTFLHIKIFDWYICSYIGLNILLKLADGACHIYFIIGHVDDLKLPTPIMHTLRILAYICEKYAAKYDIPFNGRKSKLIIYKCKQA